MKVIDTHHDGHGLNEQIQVEAVDEIGPGGAHHRYLFTYTYPRHPQDPPEGDEVGFIQFQKGPRNEPGSTPGVTEGAVLSVLIDRLTDFQAGPYPSDHNAVALTYLQQALQLLKDRADERAQRGVLGRNLA